MGNVNNKEQYDGENIFAKILRGEIPCKKIYENDFVLAFEDINPQAPLHVLIIPKEKFCNFQDFSEMADDKLITEMIKSIGIVAKQLSLVDGYRIISNIGKNGGQEVPHLHFHLLGKKRMGKILP